jgi:hypothetical protein
LGGCFKWWFPIAVDVSIKPQWTISGGPLKTNFTKISCRFPNWSIDHQRDTW